MLRTVGRYEMLREVGRGGMATVYLARQPGLDRLAALKELGGLRADDPMLVTRFVREARMSGALNHPNIVTVYDYFEDGGVPYIAMEYVEGGSLRPHVGSGLSLAQIGGVLAGLLEGMGAAARLGIVHRDLKPENVLVTAEGGIKVADFGIGKATEDLMTVASLTSTGATMGTPAYMAPEQARGLEVTSRTDLYALGIIAYELLAGRTPYADTTTPMGVLLRQVNDPIPPLADARPDLDPALLAWVERLLEKDPEDRPRSPDEAADTLEDVMVGAVGPRWRRAAALPVDDAAAVVAALAESRGPAAAEATPPTVPLAPRGGETTMPPRAPLAFGDAAAPAAAAAAAGLAAPAAAGAARPPRAPGGLPWRRTLVIGAALIAVLAVLAGAARRGGTPAAAPLTTQPVSSAPAGATTGAPAANAADVAPAAAAGATTAAPATTAPAAASGAAPAQSSSDGPTSTDTSDSDGSDGGAPGSADSTSPDTSDSDGSDGGGSDDSDDSGDDGGAGENADDGGGGP